MRRDFAPVSLVVNNVELLVVNPADPAKDAAEFVANAKKRRDPMAMASTGIGSIPHLAIEQFGDATGTKFLHVPYKGAAPAITDLMGGQVGGFFGDVPGLIGHVKSGKLKALGMASTQAPPGAARRARRWKSRASRVSTPSTGMRCSSRRRRRRRWSRP